MAEELFQQQGSLSGYKNTWNSLRCNDLFSCSAAVNVGDAGGSFGCFPATTDIFDQLCSYKSSSSFDNISPQFSTPADHWSQSFPESPDQTNNFYADFFDERSTTEQHSQVLDISQGLFLSQDQNVTAGSAMDEDDLSYNILSPLQFSSGGSLGWTTTDTNGNMPPHVISNAANYHTEMSSSNWAAVRDSIMLPIITKKLRVEPPSPLPTFKVRKEKLGDRITALQQLVSPFGKTDTASVLHEAVNYIKFLHEEVTLGTQQMRPEFGTGGGGLRLGTAFRIVQNILGRQKTEEEETMLRKDLRSRGLCLVPISSTFEMAGDEIPPFDFWTQLWRKL